MIYLFWTNVKHLNFINFIIIYFKVSPSITVTIFWFCLLVLKMFCSGYFILEYITLVYSSFTNVVPHELIFILCCMYVSESGQHWFRYLLVTNLMPIHYPNQCWVIVNWTLRNKFQWIFNQNTKLFIHKNASESIISKMMTILSWGRWVNGPHAVSMKRLYQMSSCHMSGFTAYHPFMEDCEHFLVPAFLKEKERTF